MDTNFVLKFDSKTWLQIINLVSRIDTENGRQLPQNHHYYKTVDIAEIEKYFTFSGAVLSSVYEPVLKEKSLLLKNNEEDVDLQGEMVEMAGYASALKYLYKDDPNKKADVETILALHACLFSYEKDKRKLAGKFKTMTTRSSSQSSGISQIMDVPGESFLTEPAMRSLMQFFNDEVSKMNVHPLIISAAALFEFLSINPFPDGNFRMFVLITRLLLKNSGYDFISDRNIERVFTGSKNALFEALGDSQKYLGTPNENISSWVIFYLGCLLDAAQNENGHEPPGLKTGTYMNPRQKNILALISKNSMLKLADIAALLSDVSVHTIKKDLQYMKNQKLLESSGKNRGAKYRVKK